MTQYVTRPKYIEGVEVPRLRMDQHPISDFQFQPDWLAEAFANGKIRPFMGQDECWEYIVGTTSMHTAVPGSLIVNWPRLDVTTREALEVDYEKVPERSLSGVPIFLPSHMSANAIGIASRDNTGRIILNISDDRTKKYILTSMDNRVLALTFIENTPD